MRSRGLLSVCLVAAQTLIGQTRVSLKTQGKEVDFSQATSVRPFQTGTTLPASCAEGEMFFKTDAPAGTNLYGCVAGSWVQQAGGGSSGPVLSVFGRTGHVTAQSGDYSFSQILGLVSNAQISAGVDAAKIGAGTVDNTEFGYLDGVTSPIQTQLNSKAAATHSHTLAGDVTGDVGSTSVERIRGRPVSSAAPSGGQVLAWNATLGQWEPASVSGGGSGSGTANTPLEVTRSTATQLAIGSNCSLAAPCVVRFGAVSYTYTSAATATVTSGSGTAYLYVTSDGSRIVGIPSSGMSVSCTGCSVVSGVTAFPVDSLPLYTWSASTAQWSASGTDYRAILSAGRRFVGGPGISVAESGSTVTISATGGGGGGGSGGGYATVQDEGTSLAQRSILNFTGGGVTCSDDSANGRTNCSIPDTMGGDVTGTQGNTTVSRIQGRNVASAAPSNGQVLTWNQAASQWEPQTPASGGGGGGMPALFAQKMLRFALPGNGFMQQLGFALNVDGSQSNVGASSSAPHQAIRYTSGATSGSDAGLTSGIVAVELFRRGEVFRAYVGMGSTVNLRTWIGLSELAGAEPGTDSPGFAGAWFRYSTSAGDTNFKCVTCSGGCTVTDSGVAADTNRHLFEISWTGTAYQFKIDNTAVCTNTNNLPPAGTAYAPVVRLRTLENASKTLDIGGVYLETNF